MSMSLAKGSTEHFFASIDWMLLHQQKVTLVEHIAQRREALEDLADTDPTLADLEGILHLIDGVQDFFDAWIPGDDA
jgi:hypothetical protein